MSESPEPKSFSRQLEISGNLDRRRAEALALELRHLARQYNLEVDTLRVTSVEPREDSTYEQPD